MKNIIELDKKLFGDNKLRDYENVPFHKVKRKQHIKYTVPYGKHRICYHGIVLDYMDCQTTMNYKIIVKGYDSDYPLTYLCTKPESEILFYRKKSIHPRKDWMYFCTKCNIHFKGDEYEPCPLCVLA